MEPMMKKKVKMKDIESEIKKMDVDSALQYLFSLQGEQGLSLEKLTSRYIKKREALDKEFIRFNKMLSFENAAYKKGYNLIAGTDEAGRGPLAGPVVAAAVILPRDIFLENLNDSKQLSSKQRDVLFDEIKEKAVAWGVGIVDEKCIDDINILQATKQAMCEAVISLTPFPDLLLTDAVRLEEIPLEQISIVKGDCLSASIAAASIIAKVTRDRIIEKSDSLYPQYGFAKHKGYGTQEHINAIKKYGICPIHRITFTKNFV